MRVNTYSLCIFVVENTKSYVKNVSFDIIINAECL